LLLQLAWQFGELINTGDGPQLGNLLHPNPRFASRYCCAAGRPMPRALSRSSIHTGVSCWRPAAFDLGADIKSQ
jgi:hypothetical protein